MSDVSEFAAGELAFSCVTGTECVVDTDTFYLDSSTSYTFLAFVGASGVAHEPGGVADAVDGVKVECRDFPRANGNINGTYCLPK